MYSKEKMLGWSYSSVAEHLSSTCEASGSSPTLSKAVVEVERREEEDRSDAGVHIKAVSEGITEEDGQRNGK